MRLKKLGIFATSESAPTRSQSRSRGSNRKGTKLWWTFRSPARSRSQAAERYREASGTETISTKNERKSTNNGEMRRKPGKR